MNKQEILEEIKKTEEHLATMKKMLEDCEYERWKPKKSEAYFYINSNGTIGQDWMTKEFSTDETRYNFYNCFRTKEQAEAEAEKIHIRRMLEDIARRLNKGEKIDWKMKSSKYHLCIDECGYIYSNACLSVKYQGTVYCLDKSFGDIAIQEIGEERLKKYLRGE